MGLLRREDKNSYFRRFVELSRCSSEDGRIDAFNSCCLQYLLSRFSLAQDAERRWSELISEVRWRWGQQYECFMGWHNRKCLRFCSQIVTNFAQALRFHGM